MSRDEGVNALKQWTGKTRATVLYDSTVDEFTHDGLFAKVKGRPYIAIVGFTTQGDVFGGYYTIAITKRNQDHDDPNMFIFSFESHGRCKTPQRFLPKEGLKEKARVGFAKDRPLGFVLFGMGPGYIWHGNEKSGSYCWNLSDGFEGIERTTLSGKSTSNSLNPPNHYCTRLVAVQLTD